MDRVMLIVTWLVLGVWVVGPLMAIAAPQRQHDPQRGMAVGLLMIVSMIGLGVALVFGAGLLWDIAVFKRVPTWIAGFIVVLIAANGAAYVARAIKR